METQHFLTAIEEETTLSDSNHVTDPGADKNVPNEKSDVISESVKTRKPRPIDQFFAQQADARSLTPIKSKLGPEAMIDPTQESLELKLDSSECPAHSPDQAECIQPDNLTFTVTDDTFDRLVEEAGEDCAREDCPRPESPSRKRPQEEMEPPVFDVPRGAKLLHREEHPLPKFSENAKPLLQFSSGTDELFKPKIGDGMDLDLKPEKTSPKISAEPATADQPESDDKDERTDPLCEAEEESLNIDCLKASNRRFNMTLDMTLRTSGGVAFASGLFLAIDEALDPLVGALLPHGRRRRGVNIFLACIPIFFAIYFLFFR